MIEYKRLVFGLMIGILILGIGFVIAEDNVTCSSNADCGEEDITISCANETSLCITTITPTCYNATTNDSYCEDVSEEVCEDCSEGEICEVDTCVAEAVCDSDNLDLCLNEIDCTDAGRYWYNDACNEEEEEDEGSETDGGTTVTMNKTKGEKRLTFVPWQKRNESECLEECNCRGAVMTCPIEGGKQMTIEAGRSGNLIIITFVKNGDETEVETELELETDSDDGNNTELKAKMSNGQTKRIRIMPDVASERALERLRLKVCSEDNNCTIELKEVGNRLGYEVQVERHMRLLAMFKMKAQVKAQVDAETGELISVNKPWWAFLATEPEE